MRLGIYGLGQVVLERHLDELRAIPEISVTHIATRDSARFYRAMETYRGDMTRVGSLSALAGHPDIDAVLIATPASDLLSSAEVALRAGKLVYLEKPLGASYADALRITALEGARDRMVVGDNFYFQERFVAAIGHTHAAWLPESTSADIVDYLRRGDRVRFRSDMDLFKEHIVHPLAALHRLGQPVLDAHVRSARVIRDIEIGQIVDMHLVSGEWNGTIRSVITDAWSRDRYVFRGERGEVVIEHVHDFETAAQLGRSVYNDFLDVDGDPVPLRSPAPSGMFEAWNVLLGLSAGDRKATAEAHRVLEASLNAVRIRDEALALLHESS